MTKYRARDSRDVEIEAWQAGTTPVPDWLLSVAHVTDNGEIFWDVVTEENIQAVIQEGDYLIKEGTEYSYSPKKLFEQTYEPVKEMLDSGAGEDFACPWCGAYNIPRSFRDSGGHLTESSFCPGCGKGLSV